MIPDLAKGHLAPVRQQAEHLAGELGHSEMALHLAELPQAAEEASNRALLVDLAEQVAEEY